MGSLTEYERPSVGRLLRWWRNRRGFSQMELALSAGISPRHMSFVETGRSRPGRDVVVRLAEALDLPIRERNVLLESAGYARMYRESSLEEGELGRLRELLEMVLDRYEPYGAVVVDAEWRLLMANGAHRRLAEHILGADARRPGDGAGNHSADGATGGGERPNLLLQLFRPGGLGEKLVNWPEVAHHLLDRLRRQVAESPTRSGLRDLLETLEEMDLPPAPEARPPRLPVLPMHFDLGDGTELRLVSFVSTFGAPQDVAVQELRLEAFLPADDASEAVMRNIAGHDLGGT